MAVTTSLVDPILDFEVNARGTLNLLEAARREDPPPFVLFTSTNKVYGALEDVALVDVGVRYVPVDPALRRGISEARGLAFHSPYGCSKGAAEQYVLDWAHTYGVPATVFRMSCIYGPRQFGTEDQGWVAHFLIQAIQGRTLTLYGDGKQVRDVLFVDDLVDAFLLARENASRGRGAGVQHRRRGGEHHEPARAPRPRGGAARRPSPGHLRRLAGRGPALVRLRPHHVRDAHRLVAARRSPRGGVPTPRVAVRAAGRRPATGPGDGGDTVTTMRAAVLASPRRIELASVPRPAPAPGEVLVRLEGCGVCGSNLVPWQGREWFTYPFAPGAPGHEGWGRIAEVGAGVAGLAEGNRVALLSGAAFAEYDVAAADRVVRIPAALEGPFPGEALGCGVNVFRRSAARAGDQVAVVGAGFIGLVALRLAALAGARVVALSRRETSLRRAREMGAAEVVPLVRPRLGDRGGEADARAGGSSTSSSRRSATRRRSTSRASSSARAGGSSSPGTTRTVRARVNLGQWNWRGIEVVNAHERDPRVQREGVLAAAGAVAEGKLDPAPLFATYPLDRLAAAFQAMEERPDGFVKALVTP